MPETVSTTARPVRRAVTANESDLDAAHARIADLEKQLADTQKAMSGVDAKNNESGARVADLEKQLAEANARIAEFESREVAAAEQRHAAAIEAAVNDGRLKKEDTASQDFWRDALKSSETKAVAALEALPKATILAKVTEGTDPSNDNALDVAARQERAIAEVRDAHPNLGFKAVFAKAREKHPALFRT